jgi:putative transcriptional regulator
MKIENLTSDEAILDELGARIARQRLNKNMTQEALAKEAGISLPTLKRIEAGGYPTNILNVIRILRVLKLLENLEFVIPAPPISPLQQVRLQGKKVKKRASTKQSKSQTGHLWNWGDKQ